MSFPSINPEMLSQASKHLQAREYVVFEMTDTEKKTQDVFYGIIEKKSDSSLQATVFKTSKEQNEYIHSRINEGYKQIDFLNYL